MFFRCAGRSQKAAPLRIPDGFDISSAKLVLQNYKNACPKFLNPFETRVYLWKK